MVEFLDMSQGNQENNVYVLSSSLILFFRGNGGDDMKYS